ncbi:MAG: 2-oxopent-4-enoate hydratase [Burkholderiales bacterium]
MDTRMLAALGDRLYDAWRTRQPVTQLTEAHPDMTLDDAYAVQQRMIARRREAGLKVVGRKIGLTSQVVQKMLGVDQPDFGVLLSDMVFGDGDALPTPSLIAPKVEGEIAFVLKHGLQGPGVTTADVLRATDFVMPCFEIVDSRIRDWKIRIQDTVADNASAGLFVLGGKAVDPRDVDLSLCGMVLEKNGEIVATGAGAAALGSPVNAVAWLANRLGQLGIALEAGEVILSGSLAAMLPAQAGDSFRCTLGGIGSVATRFA